MFCHNILHTPQILFEESAINFSSISSQKLDDMTGI